MAYRTTTAGRGLSWTLDWLGLRLALLRIDLSLAWGVLLGLPTVARVLRPLRRWRRRN